MTKEKATYLYGKHPIMEALQAKTDIDKIWLQADIAHSNPQLKEISNIARAQNIATQRVPVEKLNYLTRHANHQGVVAARSKVAYNSLDELLTHAESTGQAPLFLLIDGVTDVRNLGAIIRSAAAMGVHGIILPPKGVAPINAEALKAAAGGADYMKFCRAYLDDALSTFQLHGIMVVASSLKASTAYADIDLTQPLAHIIGAEDKGVSPKFIRRADAKAKIPMPTTFDSLNVSVATGIILYETDQQRQAKNQ